MTPKAFREYFDTWRRGAICCITLTQDQADEMKAYIQSRARDRSNLAPIGHPASSSHAGGRLGSGRESQSSSSAPTLNS